MNRMSLVMLFFGFCFVVCAQKLESVKLKTKAEKNKELEVWFSAPKGYDAKRKASYRVLILFGGRNEKGQRLAGGALGFLEWADKHKVFLVSPSFYEDEYWQPRKWSGKALMKALGKIKGKYNICTLKLLYYGFSGGSQASNLFPAWRPSVCRAWVSHAGGVFHEPSRRMVGIPGLVTCGDADLMRYVISRRFVDASRKKGVSIMWKSFPNLGHAVPPDSLKLAQAFLAYYHQRYITDLSRRTMMERYRKDKILYVGDDVENTFYAPSHPYSKRIAKEDKIEFPSRELALMWGMEGKGKEIKIK